jgi:hypothetical protein
LQQHKQYDTALTAVLLNKNNSGSVTVGELNLLLQAGAAKTINDNDNDNFGNTTLDCTKLNSQNIIRYRGQPQVTPLGQLNAKLWMGC